MAACRKSSRTGYKNKENDENENYVCVFFVDEKTYSVINQSKLIFDNNKTYVMVNKVKYRVSVLRSGTLKQCNSCAVKMEKTLETNTELESTSESDVSSETGDSSSDDDESTHLTVTNRKKTRNIRQQQLQNEPQQEHSLQLVRVQSYQTITNEVFQTITNTTIDPVTPTNNDEENINQQDTNDNNVIVVDLSEFIVDKLNEILQIVIQLKNDVNQKPSFNNLPPIMYKDTNLLKITASDKYKYCLKLLDELFTKDELKAGAVEPTGRGQFSALDQERINMIKEAVRVKYNINEKTFGKIWLAIKTKIER